MIDDLLATLAERRPDRRLPLVLLALAALGIGGAMAIHPWTQDPIRLGVLALGVLALLGSLAVSRRVERQVGPAADLVLRAILGATIVAWVAGYALGTGPVPDWDPPGSPLGAEEIRLILVAAGLVAISGLRSRAPLGRLHTPVLVALVGIAGAWMVLYFTQPGIDVWVFQRDAATALAHGTNPYAIDFPNIYPDDRYYGPGVVVDGRVVYGYPYPPLSLAAYVPATLLTGDPRWGNLIAILAAGALVAWSRPGPVARGAAAVLLLTPSLLFLLHESFMEPIAVLAIAATVAAACRAPRLTGIALGCLLFAKQYCLIVLPFALMLLPRGSRVRDAVRLVVTALVVMAAILVPFLLWDGGAFIRAVIEWQLIQPFRADSLGFGPMVAEALGGTLPAWLAFAAAGLAGLLALWRVAWTPSGFAWATGLVLTVFVALSKQAFPNYYLMGLGCLVIAIAAARPGDGAPATEPVAGAPTAIPS